MNRPRVLARYSAWPCLVLALVLLGVAIGYSTFPVLRDTYRYIFVIDITQSMNVSDLESGAGRTTRLEFAKASIETAIGALPCGSEAGLAIFTAHRTFVMFTPVEICEHYGALSAMLAKIDWRMAWTARSEISKGLYSAIDAALHSSNETRLVFLTDGHEAPPINRDIVPRFAAEPGSVLGLIGGVGGLLPSRIPHLDDEGNVIGYWGPDEVMQIDIYSLGRAATEQGEAMVGVDMANVARRIAIGQEHLSSLREAYLQELAARTGLDYVRLDSPAQLVQSLQNGKYARRTRALSDFGWIPAAVALLSLTFCFSVIARRNRPAPPDGRSFQSV